MISLKRTIFKVVCSCFDKDNASINSKYNIITKVYNALILERKYFCKDYMYLSNNLKTIDIYIIVSIVTIMTKIAIMIFLYYLILCSIKSLFVTSFATSLLLFEAI